MVLSQGRTTDGILVQTLAYRIMTMLAQFYLMLFLFHKVVTTPIKTNKYSKIFLKHPKETDTKVRRVAITVIESADEGDNAISRCNILALRSHFALPGVLQDLIMYCFVLALIFILLR